MKLFATPQTRDEYLATQIERSESKFNYCKVSVHDVRKYRELIGRETQRTPAVAGGPILCLGTRNGREVDIFRMEWHGSAWLSAATRQLEASSPSFHCRVPWLESIGRSDLATLQPTSVLGVELNPRAERRDVWIGSFDQMPATWAGAFSIVYSNAFDQSQDPVRTAAEWKRVIRPGGFLIFCFTNGVEPTVSDRVGGLTLPDVQQLFGGRLVVFHDRGSRNNYSEVILQL